MTRLYVQWTVVMLAAAVVAVAASRYYDRHLTSYAPEGVLAGAAGSGVVRVQGRVEAGTLSGDPAAGRAAFRLGGEHEALQVEYDGPPPENLRELKTLVVVGQWDQEAGVFRARDLALVSNYHFVAGAYLVGFAPLALFLFTMERRVRLLYEEIKQAKFYEPETSSHVDSQ